MKTLTKYLRVLIQIVSMSNSSAAIYRVDYLLRIIRSFLEIGVAFVIISSFYFKAQTIAGWNQWEALLVFSIFQIVSTFVFIFAGYGITSLSRDIVRGSLDRFLVLPMDSQFLASIRISYITNLFRLFFGVFLMLFSISKLDIEIHFFNVILTFVSIISSMVVYFCLTFSVSALAFWTFSGELGELMSTITSISRFPVDYFSRGVKVVIYILPLAFISSVPAMTLLGKNNFFALLSPVIALTLFFLTRKLWKVGLKSYQSASS